MKVGRFLKIWIISGCTLERRCWQLCDTANGENVDDSANNGEDVVEDMGYFAIEDDRTAEDDP